jgi:hypothetical protein
MTLGIALVLIFILYLIDKNQVWRQTLKVVVGVAVVGALAIAGFYGWAKVSEWREAKAAQRVHEAYEKRVDACVAREAATSPPEPAGFSLDRSMCEENPDRDWGKPQSDLKVVSSLVEIHGGDTLQIAPPQTFKNGRPTDIPLVYLGRHQVYIFACGHFGETQIPKDFPAIKGRTASCP